jgi:hypothetical protein
MLNRLLFRKHLDADEQLVRIVHKHWLTGFKALFWPSLLLLGCAAGAFFFPARGPLIVFGLTGIVVLVWWLRNFFDYFLDAWMVTSTGIIDVAWHGWFHRQSARILYSDIQGVSYEIKGVIATLLRVGTLTMEKVSTGTAVSLEDVQNPKKVEATILRCMETYLHSKNLKDSKQVQQLLASIVAQHMQMQDLPGSDDADA